MKSGLFPIFLILNLGFVGTILGVDIDPPEIPNPYSIKEERALRKHLLEVYNIKTGEMETLEGLRVKYRNAWNEKQLNLIMNNEAADPRYIKAQEDEQAERQKKNLLAKIQALGGKIDETLGIDQLKSQLDLLLKLKADKERTEAERIKEEHAKAIEASHKGASIKVQSSAEFYPPPEDFTGMPDEDVLNHFRQNTSMPNLTAKERQAIEDAAQKYLERYRRIKNEGFKIALLGPNGAEIWIRIMKTDDPEKVYLQFEPFNPEKKDIYVCNLTISILNSFRNDPEIQYQKREQLQSFLMPGLGYMPLGYWKEGPLLVDPGMEIKALRAYLKN